LNNWSTNVDSNSSSEAIRSLERARRSNSKVPKFGKIQTNQELDRSLDDLPHDKLERVQRQRLQTQSYSNKILNEK